MATTPFKYQAPFPLGPDTTEYYLLTKDYVSVSEFEGTPVLKVAKEGLTAMANAAFRDVSFMLRRSHNEQVAKILSDPEASDNDKYVALTFLRNAEVAAKGVLPFCQDTGTAIIHGEKGQQVWTGYCDEEALSLGVYKTYTEENLRYSQNAPLNMYDEVNTKCNLPAQIDIEATEGMEYKFLCVTKGGGSANKTYLYQETKAILNPGTLVPFIIEKIKTLGTAACPPYHIAVVIGGTSAEKNLLTVKLASTHYYDELPTTGNEYGRAFRDIELEKEVLAEVHNIGLGAQFGGKYLAHDIRIIRLPRHGASCPVGLGVSCSADRNVMFYAGEKKTVHVVPLRKADILAKKLDKYVEKGIRYWKSQGAAALAEKVVTKVKNVRQGPPSYQKWIRHHLPDRNELEKQKKTSFGYRPKISFVVPLYKTPEKYLRRLTESFQEQTYSNWELCFSDGSGAQSPLTELLKELTAKDNRIKYVSHEESLQISENTNSAIEIATGDFIAFADHDDELTPNALFECVKAINEKPQTLVIYLRPMSTGRRPTLWRWTRD